MTVKGIAYAFFLCSVLLAAARPASSEVYLDGEEIVFSYRGPEGSSIYLVGDFNGWNPTIDRMIREGDAYKITIFLLPGRHKYLYFVDGESVRDEDNPCVDQEGNSCFNFVEREGDYKLYFTERAGDESKPVELEYKASAVILGSAGEDSLGGVVRAEFNGNIRKKLGLDFSVGCLRSDKEAGDIKPALVRAESFGDFGKLRMRAFSRSTGIEMDDPLAVLGEVGPYDYPVGLFCRGVEASFKLTEGMRARAFYANRLEGYPGGTGSIEAGFEKVDSIPGLERLSRDPADMDLFGVVATAGLAGLRLSYIFRKNRSFSKWNLEGWEQAGPISGLEETDIHGLWFSYPVARGTIVELEYLRGLNKLNENSAVTDYNDGEYYGDAINISSWKGYASVERAIGKNEFKLFYSYEKEGEIEDQFLDKGYGQRHEFGFSAMVELSRYRMRFSGVDNEFRGAGPGDFWFQRDNFWLDGDRVTPSRLLFLDSGGILESNLSITDAKEGKYQIPVPGNTSVSLSLMCQSDDISRRVVEIRGVKSLLFDSLVNRFTSIRYGFLRNVDLLADIRCVSYNHDEWSGRRDFVDTFLGVRKSFGNSSWMMAGVGARPYAFDRWYFGILPRGRMKFIEERGVLEYSRYQEYSDLYGKLSEAESELSRNWSVSFEGCLKF